MHFQILGAGAWGTAMAIVLARGGHSVLLTPRSAEQAHHLEAERVNSRYLPGHALPDSVRIQEWNALPPAPAPVCILACPSFGLRQWADLLKERQQASPEPLVVISLAKGLETDTYLLPSQVLDEVLPESVLFSLSGPNFAPEVAQGLPAAAVLAGDSQSGLLEDLQAAFGNSRFRIYTSEDRYGVELGGSLKNVYAIGMGICAGLQLGDNAKAALLTRSLHEMVGLIPLLNGKQETAYGLSGVGDLVATCYGCLSRNRAFGEAIGKGNTIEDPMRSQKSVVEGYYACKNFYDLFKRHSLKSPILVQIHEVLYSGKAPADALQSLMTRELKPEKSLISQR